MNTKLAGLIVVGIALLAGLFWAMKPDPATQAPPLAPPKKAEGAPANSTNPIPLRAKVLDVILKLEDGQRVAGPALISALQGQQLRLTVLSNQADELHVHGYDIAAPLAPDEPVELSLVLETAGRFEIELHGTHSTVTVLEVQPAGN